MLLADRRCSSLIRMKSVQAAAKWSARLTRRCASIVPYSTWITAMEKSGGKRVLRPKGKLACSANWEPPKNPRSSKTRGFDRNGKYSAHTAAASTPAANRLKRFLSIKKKVPQGVPFPAKNLRLRAAAGARQVFLKD